MVGVRAFVLMGWFVARWQRGLNRRARCASARAVRARLPSGRMVFGRPTASLRLTAATTPLAKATFLPKSSATTSSTAVAPTLEQGERREHLYLSCHLACNTELNKLLDKRLGLFAE